MLYNCLLNYLIEVIDIRKSSYIPIDSLIILSKSTLESLFVTRTSSKFTKNTYFKIIFIRSYERIENLLFFSSKTKLIYVSKNSINVVYRSIAFLQVFLKLLRYVVVKVFENPIRE